MPININELKSLLVLLDKRFSEKRDYLIEMDSHLGDGDLGITMSKIFQAASKNVSNNEQQDAGLLLIEAGMAMAKAAPSTMGTLMATAFMEAGKKLKGKNSITVSEWPIFFSGLKEGIAKRGKVSEGQKTIFDVVSPVAGYLSDKRYETEKDLFADLCPYAADYLKKTKDMEAQHGKAACFGAKSKGHTDAGATVAFLLIETIAEFFGVQT